MNINGRKVNANSVVMENIDIKDYPDFCDAFASSATFVDGTPLNETELEQLTERYGNDLVHENLR